MGGGGRQYQRGCVTSAVEYKYFPIEEISAQVYTKMAAAQATEEFLQKLVAEMSPEDEQYLLQLLAENAPQRGLSERLFKT